MQMEISGSLYTTGEFSVLQVSFNMQRLSGYFLIQVLFSFLSVGCNGMMLAQ